MSADVSGVPSRPGAYEPRQQAVYMNATELHHLQSPATLQTRGGPYMNTSLWARVQHPCCTRSCKALVNACSLACVG